MFCAAATAQPVNDDCANASYLCPNQTIQGLNISATAQCTGPDGDCLAAGTWGQCYDVNNSVWYRFMSNSLGGAVNVTISNINSVNATGSNQLQAVLLSAGAPCNAATYAPVDCNSGSSSNFTLSGVVAPCTEYWVQIDGGNVPPPQAQCTYDIQVSGPGVDWVVNQVKNDVSCFGYADGDATVTPGCGYAPFSFQWDDPGNQNTAQATGLSAGTYNCTITDANGCSTVVQTTIIEPAGMTITPGSVNATCGNNDGQASVVVGGGQGPPYTYLWDASAGNQTSAAATGLAAGIYSVTVTDGGGCTQVVTVGVSDTGGPTVNMSFTQPTCNGGANATATANAVGIGPFSFLWSPGGQTAAIITGLVAGTYTVQVTDANGCITVATVTVTEPPPLTVQLNTTAATCGQSDGDASANPAGGIPGYSYLWSTGATTQSITGLASGNYSVTVTDNNGCTEVASAAVGTAGGLNVSTSSTLVSCNGNSDGTATVTPSGGTPPYGYQWDAAAGGQNTPTATGLAAGTYSVTITDASGCDTVVTLTVYEPAAIIISSVVADANCGASDGAANVSASGGQPPFSYQWDAQTGGQMGQTATGLAAGTYYVTVTGADGCTEVGTVLVSNIGGPTPNVTVTDATCYGDNNGSATAGPSGGTPPYAYQWSSGGTSATENGLLAGTYILTVTDANNCLTIIFVTVNDPGPFNITVTPVEPACQQSDGELTVTISGGAAPYTYNWSNGCTDATCTGLSQGTYTITITDAVPCDTVVTITLNESSAITSASMVITQPDCNQDNGTATVTPSGGQAPYTYSWSDGQSSNAATGLATGQYTVTITDANNCTRVETADLQSPNKPMAIAEAIDIICTKKGEINVVAAGGTSPYSYSVNGGTGQTSPSFSGLEEGAYVVVVTDAKNCSDTTVVQIEDDCIKPKPLPWSVFSPNGDGANDTWDIPNIEFYENCRVLVFNRWGQKVFSQEGYDDASEWNGKSAGHDVPAATYYYVIFLDKNDKESEVLTGHVAIIR